jgi:hypothetical protein
VLKHKLRGLERYSRAIVIILLILYYYIYKFF